ncbi:MAG: hypothetical protein HY741_29795 [Chloroflexi bacterium]|nr:hypothetical protein [Chloroflexota bacterium]
MSRIHLLGLVSIVSVFVLGLLGCQQRPAVPTVAIQPTEPVVLIVVTATSQPTLAPTKTPEPSITLIPTLTQQVTATLTATVQAKPTVAPTKAVVIPTAPPSQPTPTTEPTNPPAPSSFAAPQARSPEGKAFRDGDTLRFEFAGVGPLAADQCYRIDVTLGNPTGPGGVGDYWVGLCGDQTAVGGALRFDVKPGRFRDEPNYGTLLVSADNVIPPTPEYVMNWFVSVVRRVDMTDPVHPTVEALSPASGALQNTFFR